MRTIVAAALVSSMIGCVAGDAPPQTDEEPVDLVAGRYEITTTYDLSASEGVPSLVGDVIGPLANLRDDPGGTLIAILESAGGAVAELLELSPTLKAELDQKIDEFVFEQIAAGGAAADIIVWVDEIAGILTHFEVVSHFEIGRSDGGVASADHTLAAVAFELGGEARMVDAPELISTLTIARGVECNIAETEIAIAEHAFHLPLGDLAVVGFNKALESSLGAADLEEALGLVVDCPALAASIGEQCLGPVCIGEPEIQGLCEDGLRLLATKIEEQIASIEFAELRLAGGRATLEDVTKSDGLVGQIDHWGGGQWQTTIDIDGLMVPVDAAFSAVRLAP